MTLHLMDLHDAEQYLQAYHPDNGNVVNRALVNGAIVAYYKCFGCSECRPFPLLRDKVLADKPPEAKALFDYYKNLRDKYIAHDGSRCSLSVTGAILDPEKEYPLVDVVSSVLLTDHANGETAEQGLVMLLRLVTVTIDWVEKKIDGLCLAIKKLYGTKTMSDFQNCNPIEIRIPNNEQLFERR